MRSAMAGSDGRAMRLWFVEQDAPKAKHFVEDALRDFGLAQLRERQIAAVPGEQGDNIGVVVEASAFGGDIIRHDEIGILHGQLLPGIIRNAVRLRRESNDKAIALRLRGFGQNIRCWLEVNR